VIPKVGWFIAEVSRGLKVAITSSLKNRFYLTFSTKSKMAEIDDNILDKIYKGFN